MLERPPGYRSVRIGGLEVGGPKPVICVPIVADSSEEAVAQAVELTDRGPDLLEWRADYLRGVDSSAAFLDTLARLRAATPLPLLLTVRARAQGGAWQRDENQRLDWLVAGAGSGLADAVDLEAAGGRIYQEPVREVLGARPLVLSSHWFRETPIRKTLVRYAHDMAEAGANIVKLAVMPRKPADTLVLLSAVDRLRAELTVPLIAMAMGPLGAYTRAVAPLFGSALTFAAGVRASAPGQPALDDLRRSLGLFADIDAQAR